MRCSRAVIALVVAGLCACSSGGDGDDGARDEGGATVTTTRPDGPEAVFSGPLEGGDGVALVSAEGGPSLEEAGYAEAEYAASGSAISYTSAGPLPTDGSFRLEPGEEAEFATRVVVRRPTDPEAFNGTVVVEWLNVSSGADVAPDFTYLAAELLRGGYAWVGVSAQRIGIEGGDVLVAVPGAGDVGLGDGIRAQDPERYGDLHHPGDGFAYDIYTQVGRALRSQGEVDPLDGLEVERLLAVGESQSAFLLTTYVNGVQPLTRAFDGFLIHSRGGAAAPLGEPGKSIDLASSIVGEPTIIRADTEVPVIVVETETDLLSVIGYLPARQPDGDNLRLWEVAGSAHADSFQVGAAEDMMGCPVPINRGQQVFVLRAGLRHLDAWVDGGTPAPKAARLEVDESGPSPAFVLDDDGNARGGIRNPAVDAPVDTLSGMAPAGASVVCMLLGSTTPLDVDRLGQLYTSRDDYLASYEAATDEMIDAGFALPEDREEILAGADPGRIPD